MNSKSRTTEPAEMESNKQAAPGRHEPDQGQGTSRHHHNTPSMPHLQGESTGPAQPSAAQRARLLAMLRRGPVSTLEAREAFIMSPAARIFELRQIGLEIVTTTLKNRIAVYHLIEPPEEARP
jgi:hypothetical protein